MIVMVVQNALSVCFFALFVLMILIRVAILKKRGVRVIVFGETDKRDFLLVPMVIAIAYMALANTFGLPIWKGLVRPFWDSTAPGWMGLLLCIISIIGFALSLAGLGNSFRVGIDENKPDKLITDGMFAFSRNPLYVCFLTFFAGLLLIHRNIVIAAAVVLLVLAIHWQVLREEKFLASYYGEDYKAYRAKVRRYL